MLAIAGGKGGCGKTTTTLGLAAAVDGPAVVADADCDMPNLHALAEVDRDPTLADVGPRLEPGNGTHRWPADPSVSVLPAPHASSATAVADALERVADAVADAPVFVDCPAGAGPDAVAPLRVASHSLVVTSLCVPSLRDAAKTVAMSRAVGTPVVGAVVPRAKTVPSGVCDLLECPVLGTVPSAPDPVLDSNAVRRAYREIVSEKHVGEKILRVHS